MCDRGLKENKSFNKLCHFVMHAMSGVCFPTLTLLFHRSLERCRPFEVVASAWRARRHFLRPPSQ